MSKSKTNSHATTAPEVKTRQIPATKNVPKIITARNITDRLDYCDHLLINISRKEVKTRVPAETVKTLYMLYSTPANTRHFCDRRSISVSGYDNDGRDLCGIDEVRSYMALLDAYFPYWFYFLNKENSTSLKLMTTWLCDFQKQGKFYRIAYDVFNDFLERHLRAMFLMCQQAEFNEAESNAVLNKVYKYYLPALEDAGRTDDNFIRIKIGE